MPTRPVQPHKDPQQPQAPEPATAHPPAAAPAPAATPPPQASSISVTGPLLKDHAELRGLIGEFRGALDQFDLPRIRRALMELHEILDRHVLQEECGLFLIGMKVLRADNTKLPNLIAEHHKTATHISNLVRALYSPRLTNVEDQLRNLGYLFIDDLLHHLDDEEQIVFPAFEKLLNDELKALILKRYAKVKSNDRDELDRTPLISMPVLDHGSTLPQAGSAAQVFPPHRFRGPS